MAAEKVKKVEAYLIKGIGKDSKKPYLAVELVIAPDVTKLVFLTPAENKLLELSK